MKTRIKLWLRSLAHSCALAARKKALMVLSALVWRLDDWVHRQQTELQKEIEFRSVLPSAPENPGGVLARAARRPEIVPFEKPRVSGCVLAHPEKKTETFDRWTLRRAGVAPASKREAQQRRRMTAADFDRRFAC